MGWVSYQFKITPGPIDFQSRIKIFESDTAIKTVLGYFESGTYRLSNEDFPRESLLWAGDSVMDKVVPDSILLEQTTLRGRQESWSTPDKAREGKRAAVVGVGRRLWSEGGCPIGVHLSRDPEPRQLAGSGWQEPVVGGESRGQGIPWGNSRWGGAWPHLVWKGGPGPGGQRARGQRRVAGLGRKQGWWIFSPSQPVIRILTFYLRNNRRQSESRFEEGVRWPECH